MPDFGYKMLFFLYDLTDQQDTTWNRNAHGKAASVSYALGLKSKLKWIKSKEVRTIKFWVSRKVNIGDDWPV